MSDHSIYIESMYGAKRGEPAVQVTVTGEPGGTKEEPSMVLQMPPEEAIRQAGYLVNAATASLADGFLIGFLTDKLHLDMDGAAVILMEFRQYRLSRETEI